MDNPLAILAMLGVGFFLAILWWRDKRSGHSRGLPGASDASTSAIVIAVAGAVALVAAETVGEKTLGVDKEQSHMTWLFAAYSMLAAPIIEELVFRGYLVIEGRGKKLLWTGIVVASLGFALLHEFLWRRDASGVVLTLTPKGFLSAGIAFFTSLWLYIARFARWNPSRSLLPCFAAHAAKNVGVVIVKAASGYMGGLW